MKPNLLLVVIACFLGWGISTQTYAQDECPDAPLPQLVIGQQGNVTPGPPNNVRDMPSRDGVLVGEIPGGDVFIVLDGPVCDGELYWWQVDYNGMIGWTAEGKSGAYWVVPIASTPTPTATLTPTATPTATATPIPVNLEKIQEASPTTARNPLHISYSPDGEMISLTFINSFQVLDATTLDIIMDINIEDISEDSHWAFWASWYPNSQKLAVTVGDRFRVYSVPDGDILWEKVMPHYYLFVDREGNEELRPETLRALEFTPDGQQLVTVGEDGILRVWDYGEDEPIVAYNHRNVEPKNRTRDEVDIQHLDVTNDGERVVFSFTDGEVIHWNLRLRGPLMPPTRYQQGEYGHSFMRVTFSPDGRYIYYHDWTPDLYIWDTESNAVTIQTLPNGWIDDIAFHPENDWMILTVRRSGDVPWLIVKDIETFETRSQYRFEALLRPIAVSPNGENIIITERSERITRWKING